MVSLEIDLELENLKSTIGTSKTVVIPANTTKFKVAVLTIVNERKASGYSLGTLVAWGDVTTHHYDKKHAYDLPFQKGKAFYISQGYFGEYSHHGSRALDFEMPVGTAICAARGGIVIEVVEHNNKGCGSERCEKYSNHLLIIHSDGTIAEYTHLKLNGAKVKKGDIVKQGEVIAYSGNTGWSTGPHLHFLVYMPKMNDRESIPTYIKINNGKEKIILKEGLTALKEY
jgi:murein DD-endopeptidase MepM/ murein hydrolase activator NlpD